MEFDAVIDAELDALSNCSSDDLEPLENEVKDATSQSIFDHPSLFFVIRQFLYSIIE